MYYPDLSPYQSAFAETDPSQVNIGWLDGEHPYTQGTSPDGFVDRLWDFCREFVDQTRGAHLCELCSEPTFGVRMLRGDEELWFGTAEIRVFGLDGTTYAAPNLIYHYVVDHGYLPPEAFVRAVLEGPLPNAPEYLERANAFEWGRMAARERRYRDRGLL